MDNWYRTATELHISSLRALEQRSTAFLFTQSLLVGAFAILFTSFQSDRNIVLFIPTLGITFIGFVFSFVFYFSHQVTSKDTAYWRAYMRFLEEKPDNLNDISKEEKPWYLFYKYVDTKESKGFGTRGDASRKLPAPLLWLVSPAIFCIAWIWVLLWTIQIYILRPSGSDICLWLWVTLGILSVTIISTTLCRWHKAKDKIYEEIKELAPKNTQE